MNNAKMQSSSSSCPQTFCFHYVHLYPISLNLRRLSKVQGCVKREHRNISTVKYQKRLTPLLVIVQERVKTVQFC